MQILSTEHVFASAVLSREGIAVLFHAAGLTCQRVEHGTTTTCPSEGTNAQTLNRHYPYATNDILAVVLVLLIDTFTIVDAHLIVEHATAFGIGEEVTRELNTDVTTT